MSAVSIDEHRERLRALAAPLPVTVEPLLDCHGLRLAQDISAAVSVPAFDSSAMDGFALRRADLTMIPVTLPVDGEIPAGADPVAPAPGHAVRIMTGARVPEGCDVVVPVEQTDARPGVGPVPQHVTITTWQGRDHIRPAGDDVLAGAPVLAAGTQLGSTHLAAAAATGHGSLPVRRRPRALIVTTGDELARPGRALGTASIPDSNSVLVATSLAELGAEVIAVRHAGDTAASLDAAFDDLPHRPDLVVTTGGVSVGSHDVVHLWRASSGRARVELGHVAMQPGRPQGWGHVLLEGSAVPVVCLPGNPVAVHVGLHLFVRALIDRLVGVPDSRRTVTVPAGAGFTARPGTTRLVDVVLRDGFALPAPGGHGSHRIGTLHQADALAVVTHDVSPGQDLLVLLTR